MREKKDFFRLLRMLALWGGGGLILCSVFVYCVDPFFLFHDSWFGIPRVMENAVYQTAGAARNFDYDTAIVGSSMTDNFHISWFEELGWNTAKLSYAGARSSDLAAVLGCVFSRKNPPERIIMDLNSFQLTEPAWTAYVERPEYLYSSNPFQKVKYLLNSEVVEIALERVLDAAEGRGDNLEEAYTWEEPELFGRKRVWEVEGDIRYLMLTRPEPPTPEEVLLE